MGENIIVLSILPNYFAAGHKQKPYMARDGDILYIFRRENHAEDQH